MIEFEEPDNEKRQWDGSVYRYAVWVDSASIKVTIWREIQSFARLYFKKKDTKKILPLKI